MDANANGVTPAGSTNVRLSWTQKLDLLGMSAAAVITTGLICAPMLGPYVGRDDELETEPRAAFVMAVAAPESRPIASIVKPRPVGAMSSSRPRTASRPVSAAMSAPMSTMTRIASASPSTIAAASAAATRSSKPFGRKLAGLFTGDGTYTVRPFPTVPSERQ